MQDQIHNLKHLGIAAIRLSAIKDQEEEDKMEITKQVENGDIAVVYTTPESLIYNERWRKMLSNLTDNTDTDKLYLITVKTSVNKLKYLYTVRLVYKNFVTVFQFAGGNL